MPKVLGQAGISLADQYDVKGSVAEIDQLLSSDVQLVHEMGATIFSERVSSTIRRRSAGTLSQSTSFDQVIVDLPVTPFKIMAVNVVANTAARMSHAVVSIRDPLSERECPIWYWNAVSDLEENMRWQDDGAAIAAQTLLRPAALLQTPVLMVGNLGPQSAHELAFRGRTLAFGAGTVEPVLVVTIAFAALAGVSSYGLPIPSW